MITQKQVQDCVKNELINKALTGISEQLKSNNCLPPESVEGREWENPRNSLLYMVKHYLEILYDDAQSFAAIDLSELKPGK